MAEVDEELFARSRSGDQRAWHELFAKHQPALTGFFARRAADAAADLVQETWLQCLKSQTSYRGEASFRTFLFAVAHNVLRHHLRRRAGAHSDFGITNHPDSQPSPSSMMHRRFELGVLLKALGELAEVYRLVLELTYDEQLTSEQVGELLELPAATVRTRIRRAKELLRENVERLSREHPWLLTSALETLDFWAPEPSVPEAPG